LRLRQPAKASKLPSAFSRLLIAWSSGQTADGMRFAALPLLAFTTNPSPAAVAAVAAAATLPWLLVALPAGALVDRLNPATVIAAANIARGVAAALLVVAVLTRAVDIALLCAVGFVLTSAETFADSASQSLLVHLVPSEQLERANAKFVSWENVGVDLVGPVLAGGLFAISRWLPFAISGVVFMVAAGFMVSLSGRSRDVGGAPERETISPRTPVGRRLSVRKSVAVGFRGLLSDPVLRTLVITVAVLAGTVAAMEGVLVVYATGSLHLSKALFPTLLASYSVGLLASAGFVGRITVRFSSGAVMVASIAVVGVTLVVLGLFPQPLVAWICFAVMGAAGGIWNILSATRRQRATPRSMMATVSSAFRAFGWGAVPLGTALGGYLGNRSGVPTVFFVAGVILLVLAGVVCRSFLRPVESPIDDLDGPEGAGRSAGIRITGGMHESQNTGPEDSTGATAPSAPESEVRDDPAAPDGPDGRVGTAPESPLQVPSSRVALSDDELNALRPTQGTASTGPIEPKSHPVR
jgi:MFS family permease